MLLRGANISFLIEKVQLDWRETETFSRDYSSFASFASFPVKFCLEKTTFWQSNYFISLIKFEL